MPPPDSSAGASAGGSSPVLNIACQVRVTAADRSVSSVASVSIPELRSTMEARAGALGYQPDEAALVVDHFVDAEMRGARGHGVERLRWLRRLRRGGPARCS